MTDNLFNEINTILAKVPIDFGGGCSVRKAYVMAWLIRQFNLIRTLDIGIYRGRSLFPQAIAHRIATSGVVYGVDPYSATEALENDHPTLREQIKNFVVTTDFEKLFQQVSNHTEEFGLSKYIQLVRATSSQAAVKFAKDETSFGLIHIDGNHDTSIVKRDVDLYLPLLQPNGFLVMDDVSWDSVQPAEQKVASCTHLLLRCVTPDNKNDYAIYWKKDCSKNEADTLSRKLHYLAYVSTHQLHETLVKNSLYKLHVGCGNIKFKGWINIDKDSSVATDLIHDVTLGLPFPDRSCQFIYHEHFLEHLNITQSLFFLSECHRVLVMDGVMRVAMPSLERVMNSYFADDWKANQDWLTWPTYKFIKTRAEMVNIAMRWWGHQWLYDSEELHRRLKNVGFSRIKDVEWRKSSTPELAQRETRRDSLLICEASK